VCLLKLASFALCLVVLLSPLSAATLSSGTVTIDGTETIVGANRLFRDATASTFSAPKSFPGAFSCSGNCGFRTITIPVGGPQVTITITNTPTTVFVAAYRDSFSPTSLATNYLGDAGSSALRTFEVTVPPGSSLVLVFMGIQAGATGSVTYQVTGTPIALVPTLSTVGLAILSVLLIAGAAFTFRRPWTTAY
jgi:hypothetical protein